MKTLATPLIGRFGNQMFQYAYARAYAERHGLQLTTHPWVGQRIFEINDPPFSRNGEVFPENYRQNQESLIYTRADCKRWFKLRQNVIECLEGKMPIPTIAAHRRVGDYAKLDGFVVVSQKSYLDAAIKFGYNPNDVTFITEENAIKIGGVPDFMPDFWRLMQAPVLFRGNSTFSVWAAILGNNRHVYSPVIDGVPGGERNVPFVEGNHPRCVELGFLTDLHLKEQ